MPHQARPHLGPVELPDEAPAWDELLPRMRACSACALAATRRQVVVYRGAPAPWLLFVGEAPGRFEDEQGLPFVGRAGRILDEAAGAAGLGPDEWGVTNVFMCRPPKNKFDPAAARACRPWLGAKVASLRPRALATLGAHALEAFLPEALPISRSHGQLLRWGGRPLFPLLHPAATLRSRAFGQAWKADWRHLAQLLPELRSSPAARS